MREKPLTTSIYTFQDLIEGGYLYVDKTEYIHTLISESKGLFFLSRPRRFGKSLFLSTLKAYFLGNRELFRNLALYNKPVSWREHPVIHLDLGDRQADTVKQFNQELVRAVDEQATLYGIELSGDDAASRFRDLILTLARTRENVVILIDEYDKPILGNVQNPNLSGIIRSLKAFYAVIKATEPYQRFVFLTGVSKFSKVSVFSDLNNLTDITMSAPFATALGYTQVELLDNFSHYLQDLSVKEMTDKAQTLEKIREWYNGYRFFHSAETVYNPVSVMRCIKDGEFSNYWFETGTPTFLLDLMRTQGYDLAESLEKPLTDLAFSAYDAERISVTPLLFQTGYLTIKDSFLEEGVRLYQLGYPNREVEQAFGAYLLDAYSRVEKERVGSRLLEMSKHIKSGDLDVFSR